MRSNHALLAVVLCAGGAALCTSACKKTPDERGRASQVQLRSATIGPHTQIIGGENDHFATVRREQLQIRARLEAEIADIDEELVALRVERRDGRYVVDPMAKSAARTKQLLEHRRRLEEHAATVERADERGWDELKATVERDLHD